MNKESNTNSNTRNPIEQRGYGSFDAVLNRLGDILQGTMAAAEVRNSIRSHAALHARVEGLRYSAVESPQQPAVATIRRQGVDYRNRMLTPWSSILSSVDLSPPELGTAEHTSSIPPNSKKGAARAFEHSLSDIESRSQLFARSRSECGRIAVVLQEALPGLGALKVEALTNLLGRRSNHSTPAQSGAVENTYRAKYLATQVIPRFTDNEQASRSTLSLDHLALTFPNVRRSSITDVPVSPGVLTSNGPISLKAIKGAAARFGRRQSPLEFASTPPGAARRLTDKARNRGNESSWNGLGLEIALSRPEPARPLFSRAAMSSSGQTASRDDGNFADRPGLTPAISGKSPAMRDVTMQAGNSNTASNDILAPLIVNFSPTITFSGDKGQDELDNRILEALAHYGRDIVRIVNRELEIQRRASF